MCCHRCTTLSRALDGVSNEHSCADRIFQGPNSLDTEGGGGGLARGLGGGGGGGGGNAIMAHLTACSQACLRLSMPHLHLSRHQRTSAQRVRQAQPRPSAHTMLHDRRKVRVASLPFCAVNGDLNGDPAPGVGEAAAGEAIGGHDSADEQIQRVISAFQDNGGAGSSAASPPPDPQQPPAVEARISLSDSVRRYWPTKEGQLLGDDRLIIGILSLAGAALGLGYGLTWFLLGLRWSALAAAILFAVFVVALLLVWRTTKISLALHILAYGGVLGILGVHVSFGGGPGSAGIVAAAYFGPCLLLLFRPSTRQAVALCLMVLLLSLAIGVVEQAVGREYLTPQGPGLDPLWYAVFAWANPTVAGNGAFVVLFVACLHLKRIRHSLEQSKSNMEQLNRALMQEQQKLELERKLAHQLIANIFPEDVSASLIDLFKKVADGLDNGVDTEESLRQFASQEVQSPWAARRAAPAAAALGVSTRSTRTADDDSGLARSVSELQGTILRLVDQTGLAPQKRESATILFADIVGFTTLASQCDPSILVLFLDNIFSQIDEACREQRVEKIKTIGDCYMCVGWADDWTDVTPAASAARVLAVADRMHDVIHRTPLGMKRLAVRAGVHTGTVVSGIIGKTKFNFDIWGDAVNVASRMESTGVPGKTQVSSETYQLLAGPERFVRRGLVHVKGKGELPTYISDAHHPPSEDEDDLLSMSPGRIKDRVVSAVKILVDLITQAEQTVLEESMRRESLLPESMRRESLLPRQGSARRGLEHSARRGSARRNSDPPPSVPPEHSVLPQHSARRGSARRGSYPPPSLPSEHPVPPEHPVLPEHSARRGSALQRRPESAPSAPAIRLESVREFSQVPNN